MNLGYFVKLIGLQLVLSLGVCSGKATGALSKDAGGADSRLHGKAKSGTSEAYRDFMERFRPALIAQEGNPISPLNFQSAKLNATISRQSRQKDDKGTEFYAVLPEENVLLSGSLMRRGANSEDLKIKSEGDKADDDEPRVVCSKSKGKTTCRIGRFTFIINNSEQNFPEESIKKLVGLMYRRSQMEDTLAESAKVFKSDESAAAEEESGKSSRSQSITVDCSVVSESAANQTATLECEWNVLGLKKRYLVSGENVAELNPLEKAGTVRCNDNLFIHSTPLHVRGFGQECSCATDPCVWHLTYPCPSACSPPVTSCCENCEEDLCGDSGRKALGLPPAAHPNSQPSAGPKAAAAPHAPGAPHGAAPVGPPAPKSVTTAKAAGAKGPGFPAIPKKPGKARFVRRKRHAVRHHRY